MVKRLICSDTTGTDGSVSIPYLGTGAGVVNLSVETEIDGSTVSVPCNVLDAKFYDTAILNGSHNNDTYYKYRSNYERQADGTLITTTHETSNGYLMIDETGDTKPFTEPLCFECDIVSSSVASNGFFMVGDSSRGVSIPATTTGYHVKLEVKTDGMYLTVDDGTPIYYQPITGNYDIRFIILNGETLKFKNAVLYPI